MQPQSSLLDAAPAQPAAPLSRDNFDDLWARCTPALSTDAQAALNRLPQTIRDAATVRANSTLRLEFDKACARQIAAGTARAQLRPQRILESASLAVFDVLSHTSFRPWHACDAAALAKAKLLIEQDGFAALQEHFKKLAMPALFVAGRPSDDRDSYLRACAALVSRFRPARMVFDAEFVEWSPAQEFVQACATVGIPCGHVGIVEREARDSHSLMQPMHFPIMVDTSGKPMGNAASTRGEMPAAAPDRFPVASEAKAANDEASGPSEQTVNRISQLRARQAATRRVR